MGLLLESAVRFARPYATKESYDAQGSEDADDAGRLVGDNERHDRHGDDESVKQAPGILDEGAEPVGKGVDRELDSEKQREEEV